MEKEKIKFSDLSRWLKTVVIISGIVCGISLLFWIVSFFVGFFSVY